MTIDWPNNGDTGHFFLEIIQSCSLWLPLPLLYRKSLKRRSLFVPMTGGGGGVRKVMGSALRDCSHRLKAVDNSIPYVKHGHNVFVCVTEVDGWWQATTSIHRRNSANHFHPMADLFPKNPIKSSVSM